MTFPSLFRPHPLRNIKFDFVEVADQADLHSSVHSIIFQIRDITFYDREVFVHFDLEGRLLNIELRKNGAFPIKLLERTFQGLFKIYEDNCINLDPKVKEANYYYDYYQENVSSNEFLSQALVQQVMIFIAANMGSRQERAMRWDAKDTACGIKYPANEFLKKIITRSSWEGLNQDKAQFHSVYPTPVTVMPPETRPDINPLFAVLQITQGCWTHACERGPCAFCASFRGVAYREKDLSEVKQHIQDVQNFVGAQRKSIRKIFLSDADPLFSKKSSFDTLQAVHELWPEITSFETFISSSAILSKPVLEWKKLKSLGISKLYWGVESADNTTLKILNKPQTQAALYKAAKRLDDAKIDYVVILMSGIGLLEKKKCMDHVNHTSDFVSKIGSSCVDISKFTPLEGTEIHSRIQNNQLRNPSADEIEEEHRLLIENISKKKPQCKIRGSYGRQFV